ncbi:MAG: putative terminase large subunit [Prokaryotic dsDNA virus sp.]|nr:MAG: putative terminase large subunit [Prokaryotic dsDNA virus sp.]|tara:strand:+ start:8675 stop:10345 length:1671 start_codon:yes stop_codon:yes gene_type:complete
MSALSKRLDIIEPQLLAQQGMLEHSVYGIVDRVDKIDGELVPNIIRRWKGTIGNMSPTDEEPTILLIEKLEPMILKHKKYKCMFGGRGGTKSRMAQDVTAGEVNSQGTKVYVLRERMKSLKESIYAGIEKSIKDLCLAGFRSVPSHWEIRHKTGGKFTFGGMQNIIDMKGASNYKIFLMEEAAKTKQYTIDTLGPTLRDTPGAELWYLWNSESSQDPMSKEFIIPFQAELDKHGFYEDEHYYVVKVGYEDNPWFRWDSSLTQELEKDKQKVKRGIMSKARYNWIWKGHFCDDIANSVISEDMFSACIDAHIKLGIEPRGAKIASCDPSDSGEDECGYAERQGIVFTSIDEISAINGNRKMDEACKRAIMFGADSFGYDADGLGATLRDNVNKAFKGKKTQIYAYKGSSEIHDPNAPFKSETAMLTNKNDNLKNKDVLFNKKAQNIIGFAERVLNTWEAVVEGKYHDPDTLVSFCSKSIKPEMLEKIKAEACKTPTKPADTVKFYTKEELRKGVQMPDGSRVKIPSPNLFDAAVLSFDKSSIINNINMDDINFASIY